MPLASHAAPSFLGPVGSVLTPSADTLGRHHYALALHHQPYWNLIAANYSHRDWVELGVTFLDPTRPGEYQTHASLNAKVRALREQGNLPSLSVGVVDALDWLREGPYNRSYYGVATKGIRVGGLTQPLRVSVGGGSGNFRNGFAAVAVPVHPLATAILEYDGFHFNPCARLHLPRGFVLDIAALQGQVAVGATFGAEW